MKGVKNENNLLQLNSADIHIKVWRHYYEKKFDMVENDWERAGETMVAIQKQEEYTETINIEEVDEVINRIKTINTDGGGQHWSEKIKWPNGYGKYITTPGTWQVTTRLGK